MSTASPSLSAVGSSAMEDEPPEELKALLEGLTEDEIREVRCYNWKTQRKAARNIHHRKNVDVEPLPREEACTRCRKDKWPCYVYLEDRIAKDAGGEDVPWRRPCLTCYHLKCSFLETGIEVVEEVAVPTRRSSRNRREVGKEGEGLAPGVISNGGDRAESSGQRQSSPIVVDSSPPQEPPPSLSPQQSLHGTDLPHRQKGNDCGDGISSRMSNRALSSRPMSSRAESSPVLDANPVSLEQSVSMLSSRSKSHGGDASTDNNRNERSLYTRQPLAPSRDFPRYPQRQSPSTRTNYLPPQAHPHPRQPHPQYPLQLPPGHFPPQPYPPRFGQPFHPYPHQQHQQPLPEHLHQRLPPHTPHLPQYPPQSYYSGAPEYYYGGQPSLHPQAPYVEPRDRRAYPGNAPPPAGVKPNQAPSALSHVSSKGKERAPPPPPPPPAVDEVVEVKEEAETPSPPTPVSMEPELDKGRRHSNPQAPNTVRASSTYSVSRKRPAARSPASAPASEPKKKVGRSSLGRRNGGIRMIGVRDPERPAGSVAWSDDAFYNVSPALFEADPSVRWDVSSPFDEEICDEEGRVMDILRPHDLFRIPFLTRYVDIDEALGQLIAKVGLGTTIIQQGSLPYERLLPGYLYKPRMECVRCLTKGHSCVLANVPAPPPVVRGRSPPLTTLIPMPTCLCCQASGTDCRWELAYPDQTLHVKLHAIAWPERFDTGGDQSETSYFDERAVWFDPKDAIVKEEDDC